MIYLLRYMDYATMTKEEDAHYGLFTIEKKPESRKFEVSSIAKAESLEKLAVEFASKLDELTSSEDSYEIRFENPEGFSGTEIRRHTEGNKSQVGLIDYCSCNIDDLYTLLAATGKLLRKEQKKGDKK